MEIAKEEKASSKKWSTIELRKALVGMVNIRESVFQSTKHFMFHNQVLNLLIHKEIRVKNMKNLEIMRILDDLKN